MSTSMAGENEPKTPVKAYLELANTYVQKAIRDTPNGLTLANLTCGLFSLMMAINGLHRIGALLIFLAAICGYFDGHVARKLQATSEIGAQLDSLANLVSFGVAPAILAHSIRNWSYLMLIAFVSFPLAGAWRLAQFNVHPTQKYFIGLPILAAGLAVAFLALFSFVSPVIMIVLAVLMIAPIQVPKF